MPTNILFSVSYGMSLMSKDVLNFFQVDALFASEWNSGAGYSQLHHLEGSPEKVFGDYIQVGRIVLKKSSTVKGGLTW